LFHAVILEQSEGPLYLPLPLLPSRPLQLPLLLPLPLLVSRRHPGAKRRTPVFAVAVALAVALAVVPAVAVAPAVAAAVAVARFTPSS
jgi:hypothetical protein